LANLNHTVSSIVLKVTNFNLSSSVVLEGSLISLPVVAPSITFHSRIGLLEDRDYPDAS
jgi:hypothetical protein